MPCESIRGIALPVIARIDRIIGSTHEFPNGEFTPETSVGNSCASQITRNFEEERLMRESFAPFVRRFVHTGVLTLIVLTGTGIPASGHPTDELTVEQKAVREKAFVEQMANTTLVGSFTVDGKSDGSPLKEERYEIESVTSAGGNLWIFMTRIKYGKTDARLPVTVPVEWAGDTPMVSLTNATLPGLGSEFSARVVFHDGRYAGTWQHGQVGGHMFGRIEKTKKSDAPAEPGTRKTNATEKG